MAGGLAHLRRKARRFVLPAAALWVTAGLAGALACRGASSPGGACGEGVRLGCPCPPGLEPVGGGCVRPEVATRTCGPRADPDDLRCTPVACPRGAALDPTRGVCVPPSELSSLPEAAWLELRRDERLECPDGGVLELARGRAGCRPASACRYGTSWDGRACVAPTPCPAGALRQADGGACAPIARDGRIDLAAWAHVALPPALCPLLTSGPEQTFAVTLEAPGNELSSLSAAVEGDSADLTVVRRAVEAEAEGLRSLQLTTSATRARLSVTCGARPLSTPRIAPADPDAGS